MDFGKALFLVAAVYGITELAKSILPAAWFANTNRKINSRNTAVLAVAVGQISVFLVGASVWAHEQVIGNKALDNINVASKILVGVFLAATAAFGDRVINMGKNIGQNQVERPISK